MDFEAITYTTICSFAVGWPVTFAVFPVFMKRKMLISGCIISIFVGFFALLASVTIHPVGGVFLIYLCGILIHFAARKKWKKIAIWQNIFKIAALFQTVIYASFFLFGYFVRICGPARQSEARTNLASIATAEIAYYAENRTFSDKFDVIGWEPMGMTKYSYFLSDKYEVGKFYRAGIFKKARWSEWSYENKYPGGREESYIRYKKIAVYAEVEKPALETTAASYGVGASSDNFTAIAIGNVDSDPELDIWIINSSKTPQNIQNDVNIGLIIKLEFDIWFLEVYSDGFVIFLDRLAVFLFILNLCLYLLLTIIVTEGQEALRDKR